MADSGWRRNKWGGWFNIYGNKEERYVGGKKIVVEKGQGLSEAMKESGKFRTKKQKDEDKRKLEEKIKSTETSMKDAVEHNSLQEHMGPDGKLTPEREALHQEIIKEYFDGKFPVPEGEEKLYYMTGGGSGTGKSNFVKNESNKYFEKNFKYDKNTGQFKGNMIKIDADDLKARIYAKETDGREFSASYLHEESSALSKRINEISTDLGYHTMLDSTGDGSPEKLAGKIEDAHSKGYKVVACYGTCDTRKALDNNLERYEKKASVGDATARYVAEKEVVQLHSNVSRTLIADAPLFDKVDLYDMNNYKDIKLIASGGNGKGLSVEKTYGDVSDYNISKSSNVSGNLGVASSYQKEYNNFVDKGNMSKEQIERIAEDYANEMRKAGRRPNID